MAQRTYLIGLYLALNAAYKYITRWTIKLQGNVDDHTWTCIQAVLTALEECLPLILPPPPVD